MVSPLCSVLPRDRGIDGSTRFSTRKRGNVSRPESSFCQRSATKRKDEARTKIRDVSCGRRIENEPRETEQRGKKREKILGDSRQEGRGCERRVGRREIDRDRDRKREREGEKEEETEKRREKGSTADCEETEGLSERGVQCECNTFP